MPPRERSLRMRKGARVSNHSETRFGDAVRPVSKGEWEINWDGEAHRD